MSSFHYTYPGDEYDRALEQLAREGAEQQARKQAELEAQGLTVYRVAVHVHSHFSDSSRFELVAADSLDEAKAKARKLPNVSALGGLVQRLSEQPTLAGLA